MTKNGLHISGLIVTLLLSSIFFLNFVAEENGAQTYQFTREQNHLTETTNYKQNNGENIKLSTSLSSSFLEKRVQANPYAGYPSSNLEFSNWVQQNTRALAEEGYFNNVNPSTTFSGDGTESNPYQITNISDLKALRNDVANYDKHFILMQNLTFASADYESTNLGWSPIGNLSDSFTGSFNGNDKTIHNLFINRPNDDYIGLFGRSQGNISNLRLENVILTGHNYTGGLIGFSTGFVNNSSASGTVSGTEDVGGLVGQNIDGVINGSFTSGTVSGTENIGGLVGKNIPSSGKTATITNSYATGTVNGTKDVGGLVGQSSSIVEYSHASGDVQGLLNVGGLVGEMIQGFNKDDQSNLINARITNSFASGTVNGTDLVGGLIGLISGGVITNSSSSGFVNGTNLVGGLAGQNFGASIENSFASGDVNGTTLVGGLIGDDRNSDATTNSSFSGLANGVDLVDPIVSSLSNISFELGAPDFTLLIWTVVDNVGSGNYSLFRNTTKIDSGSWFSGDRISTSLTDLNISTYNFTIVVEDTSGNSANDIVFVTISDTTIPTISTQADLSFEFGDQNAVVLSWMVSDHSGSGNYTLFRNTTKIMSGMWLPESAISTNVTNLEIGTYNFTIVVTDANNNSANDTVFVTISDTTNPTVSSPADFSLEFGFDDPDGTLLNWTISDLSDSGTHVLYRNETKISSGTWLSGSKINTSLIGLSVGKYNFTIVVTDANNNFANDTVFVTVSDTTSPTVSSPADFSFELGDTDFASLNWMVSDLSGSGTYDLHQDGTKIMSGMWLTESTISTSLTDLVVGTHTFTITITDKNGNSAEDTVLVTVMMQSSKSSEITNIWFIIAIVSVIAILIIVSGVIMLIVRYKRKKAALQGIDVSQDNFFTD